MLNLDKVIYLNNLGTQLLTDLQINHVAQCKNPDGAEMLCLVVEEGELLGKLEDCDALLDHYNQLLNLNITWS